MSCIFCQDLDLYTQHTENDCGVGNDISCGHYNSVAELEAACYVNVDCVAYSTWNLAFTTNRAWCMKRKFVASRAAEGHDCFVKNEIYHRGIIRSNSLALCEIVS